jgi:hypothetical protein
MIDFRINATGESLDLYPDTTLSLEINNPLFDTDVIKGALAYPFDFPDTPRNRKILGFPAELLNIITVASHIASDLYINGMLFKSGTLIILKQVDSKITTSFVAGIGAINSIISNKNLPQIDYGDPEPFSITNVYTAKGSFSSSGAGIAVDFTLSGVTTTFHKHQAWLGNRIDTFNALVDLFKADTAGMAANNVLEIKSQLNPTINTYYISFIVTPGTTGTINTGNADYEGTWIDGTVMDYLGGILAANARLYYPDIKYCFPMIKAPNFYGAFDSQPGYFNFYFTPSDLYVTNDTSPGNAFHGYVVPMPFFIHIFKKVFEFIGYKISGSFLEDPDISQIIIFNNYALDNVLYDPSDVNIPVINIWASTIDLKNHVPDISIADFIKAVKNFFNLGIFVNDTNKSIEFTPLEEIIKTTDADDWTSLTEQKGKEIDFNNGGGVTLKIPDNLNSDIEDRAIPFSGIVKEPVVSIAALSALTDQKNTDIRLVTDLDQYYQCTELTDGTLVWNFFSENYYSYVIGDGKTEVPISIGTLIMEEVTDFSQDLLVPVMDGLGSSNFFDTGINKAPFTFLNWLGMQYGKPILGHVYPMASSSYKTMAGTPFGGLSLKPFDGTGKDIYTKYYKNWLNFLNKTRPVTRIVNLDLNTLMNPNMNKKKRIDNVEFMISKITVSITMQGIKPATVYLNTI